MDRANKKSTRACLYAATLLVLISAIIVLYLIGNSREVPEKAIVQDGLIPKGHNSNHDAEPEPVSNDLDGPLTYTKAIHLQQELEQWRHERGYFDKEDFLAYDSYDSKTLAALGRNGDLLALHLLATRFEAEGDYKNETQIYSYAAIYGSTNALREIAENYGKEYLQFKREGKSENARQALIDQLATYSVAKMRGDGMGEAQSKQFVQINGIELSRELKKEIDSSATKIYEGLVDQRISTGLGAYDNSPNAMHEEESDFLKAGIPEIE